MDEHVDPGTLHSPIPKDVVKALDMVAETTPEQLKDIDRVIFILVTSGWYAEAGMWLNKYPERYTEALRATDVYRIGRDWR